MEEGDAGRDTSTRGIENATLGAQRRWVRTAVRKVRV